MIQSTMLIGGKELTTIAYDDGSVTIAISKGEDGTIPKVINGSLFLNGSKEEFDELLNDLKIIRKINFNGE